MRKYAARCDVRMLNMTKADCWSRLVARVCARSVEAEPAVAVNGTSSAS